MAFSVNCSSCQHNCRPVVTVNRGGSVFCCRLRPGCCAASSVIQRTSGTSGSSARRPPPPPAVASTVSRTVLWCAATMLVCIGDGVLRVRVLTPPSIAWSLASARAAHPVAVDLELSFENSNRLTASLQPDPGPNRMLPEGLNTLWGVCCICGVQVATLCQCTSLLGGMTVTASRLNIHWFACA